LGEGVGDLPRTAEGVNEIDKGGARRGVVAILWSGFDTPFAGVGFEVGVGCPKCGAYLFLVG